MDEQFEDKRPDEQFEDEPFEDGLDEGAERAKKTGTIIIALVTVLLICASSAAVFFAIAALATGNWIMFAVSLVVVVVLVWGLNRFIRGAANSQTRETLGKD